MTSFMSEHTVEFYLVPRFRALLNTRYSHVLPFFYWKTREGGIWSRSDNFPALVTTCAMFPRRPKVNEERIGMTVNPEVYLMSEHLREAKIPTFLGFPCVSSLSEFASDFECLWFSPNLGEVDYTYHQILPNGAVTECSSLLGPFEGGKNIHEYIEANTSQQSWGGLLDLLFDVHSRISNEDLVAGRFRFGPPYKPVYFVMW